MFSSHSIILPSTQGPTIIGRNLVLDPEGAQHRVDHHCCRVEVLALDVAFTILDEELSAIVAYHQTS
jgi:hypothetical protein